MGNHGLNERHTNTHAAETIKMPSSAIIDDEVEAAARVFCKFYWLTGKDFCMGGWVNALKHRHDENDEPMYDSNGHAILYKSGEWRPTCPCWRPRLKMAREALEAAAEAREALEAQSHSR